MDPRDETPVRAGRGAYRAVAASFLIHSTVSGTWAPRLPAIKESLDLSDGELGTALVGLAIGLVVGTRLAGLPVDRFGSRPMMRAGFPLLAGTLLLPGLAGNGATLFAALLVLGVASGALDVAMNAQGIEVERRLGRPILSGLHGLWSGGLGIGAGVAAIAAAIDAGARAPRRDRLLLVRGRGRGIGLERGLPHAGARLLARAGRGRIRGVRRDDGDRPLRRGPAEDEAGERRACARRIAHGGRGTRRRAPRPRAGGRDHRLRISRLGAP